MSTREPTARRKLNFQREKETSSGQHATRSLSRSTSFKLSSDDNEILMPSAIKDAVAFFETAKVEQDAKAPIEIAETKRASDVRALVQQGPPVHNAAQYARLVREQLVVRMTTILKDDEWIFSGEKLETDF